MSDPSETPDRPQYLLDRERDIQTIIDSLDRMARRRADYEARLEEERANG